MRVILKSEGNPDFGQYASLSPTRAAEVASLEEASAVCRSYIADWDLGGGNWVAGAGNVYDGDRKVAHISYNGRIWPVAA